MNLKNVLRLTGVYNKSSRLITRSNFRKFKEKRWETYALYAASIIIGVLIGAGVGYLYLTVPDESIRQMLRESATGLFVSLPTMCVLYSLVLTMMFQVQSSGAKISIQPVYWFPVTWEEHTAASVLSSTLTGVLWITMLICSGILAASAIIGLLPIAALTSLCLIICMAMMGVTVEALRAVLRGVSGAVLKAAGKTAVWVRFFTMILLFTVVYVGYFALNQSSMAVVFKSISEGQLAVWFIPYVWPGLATYAFSQGLWAGMALLFLGSIIFTVVLFMVAARLNARYALSDAPAIRVSSAYASGKGILNRLGLPAAEAAIVKKDFRAFTRRSELMYVFIVPIMMIVATFMPLIMGGNSSTMSLGGAGSFLYLYLALLPSTMMALMLGMMIVGSEGERLWFLNASPLPTQSFVKGKFLFFAILCTAIALVCCAVGYLIFEPSLRLMATGIVEALLLAYTVGLVALSCGIAGADFRELPRPRMVRTEWSLASMILGFIAGLLVLLPVIAYGGMSIFGSMLPSISLNGAYLYVAWLMSGIIALSISYLFYRISIRNAHKLLDAID